MQKQDNGESLSPDPLPFHTRNDQRKWPQNLRSGQLPPSPTVRSPARYLKSERCGVLFCRMGITLPYRFAPVTIALCEFYLPYHSTYVTFRERETEGDSTKINGFQGEGTQELITEHSSGSKNTLHDTIMADTSPCMFAQTRGL